MTYNDGPEDPKMEGDYLKLEGGGGGGCDGVAQCEKETPPSADGDGGDCQRRWSLWWWGRLGLVAVFVGVLAVVFLKWVGPFLMDKEMIPMINWERETFSKKELGLLIFGSLAIFPSLLIPSSPSMWVAGITFGYGYGFLLVIGGVTIGVSLPYFSGSIFYHKIQSWLDRYPKKASVIRLAGEGSWFNQFRAVAFIRISPFPYILYNYCAVATDVKYAPYLFGTLIGMVPEIFLTLYTGIIIQTIADASHNQHTMSAAEILLNVSGFCITVATTVMVTIYAKRRLKELQKGELLDGR